jgi:uncharacterized protein YecT (DUF1311 family)
MTGPSALDPDAMTRCNLLLPLLLAAPLALQAAGRTDPDTLCAPWQAVPVPAADAGTAAQACDTMALYYGADGTGGDPIAARHCAYQERDRDPTVPFGGSGVLMMLYANGEGVARDLPLARRFACEYGGAPAEVRFRLDHLARIEADPQAARIDLCDDITSGHMSGLCAGRDAHFAAHGRAKAWQTLQADWTPEQRAAWRRLRDAADAYFEKTSAYEIDLSGTARNVFLVGARERQETQLLEDVQQFERGARPEQSSASLAPLDATLNAVYRDVRARLRAGASPHDTDLLGTIDADGVRDTQRAWLRYRDAFVAFAVTRWPDVEGDAWRAWLTDRRTGDLEAILDSP